MYVVRVKPQKEDDAKISLDKKGYKVIIPKVTRLERRHSRWDEVERKIFSGYIFLDESDLSVRAYIDIKSNDFVLSFLGEECFQYKLRHEEEMLIRHLNALNGILEFEQELELFKAYNIRGATMRVVHIDKRRSRATFKFYIGDNEHYISLTYKVKNDI